jgi:Flp pilus assembly protein TadG
MNIFRKFFEDRRGTTAVIFGLSIIPLVGGVGVALDYGRAIATRQAAQNAADATSLAMAVARKQGETPDFHAMFNANFRNSFAAHDLDVQGSWDAASGRYTVKVAAILDTTIGALFQPVIPVGVTSVAEAYQSNTTLQIDGVNLSPEAADYNELYAYCYDQVNKDRLGPINLKDPKGPRLPFAKIADNSDEGVAATPSNLNVQCAPNETVSIQMRNVRDARTNPAARLKNKTYNYFTDTTIETYGANANVPRFHPKPANIIESIQCDTKSKCVPKSKGGVLPENHQTDRTPAVNDQACVLGQYIYLGWEDRPPGIGEWTDRDYDDIRIVMKCGGSLTGPVKVRLVS